MVANFARAVPGSFSVSLAPHRFYDFSYDFQLVARRGDWVRSRLQVPWEFGKLAAGCAGFVYVGPDGFLLGGLDARRWEFAFLKRHNVLVACVFTGSDIRSPALMRQFQKETGLETIATYLDQVSPVFATAAYDEQRKRLARVADEYADVIFNASVDQLSYLARPTEPFPYFFPDEDVLLSDEKHSDPGPRIVVHAPSSPIIKGTQVVRAAVQRLQSEGYAFEYRELINVPHDQVIAALREAHIVLNEFYAFVPGVFGVEAMASGCALLTRADERIETDLPAGSNQAWVVTTAADIYTNLKGLLDQPQHIETRAAAGREWVLANATTSTSGRRVRAALGWREP
ncbi:glycosyltransferase [Demequina sp. TTPB684]|uniref:glycosyltransferase n=1 Tax=unclassified Demequina TaxID=2620311 RepID=UPI001CF25203|nr:MULTISPECIES: glycosyltransferase [unclassified Demequina]MCB2413605.1 glycosyltransferase [Demequina sp. TTPB684]UPU88271.1 glycosyltransferase [Demequina sp. TMPB413]